MGGCPWPQSHRLGHRETAPRSRDGPKIVHCQHPVFGSASTGSVSGNFKLRCCVIAGLLAADVTLIVGLGLHVSVSDLYKPLGFILLLTLLSIVYWYRREPTFILVLSVLSHLVLFGWSYMVLLYAGASLGRPFIDNSLAEWDRLLGYHEPAVVNWAHLHPSLNRWLSLAYNSLLIQTGILIAVLG